MSNALFTGVSGLIAHQRMLDVVGHNIANLNTTGYKAQQALFADLFYETISAASGPTTSRGGTNGSQIGQGVRLSQVDRDFSPGTLEATGGQYDLAIEGDGFFVLSDGGGDVYSRAGTFYLDANGVLVAPGGLQVQRLPGVGEPDGVNTGFQVPGNSQIRIPNDATIAGVPTSDITVTGHLSTMTNPPLATVMTSFSPFKVAGQAADGSTLLNELDTNSTPYVNGDAIIIDGRNADGSDIAVVDFPVSDTTTLQDLVDAINADASGFAASLQAGNLVLTADETGPSDFVINLRDRVGNVGSTNLPLHEPKHETTVGANAGVDATAVTIIDPRGAEHELQLAFERTEDDIWRMNVAMDPSEGTVVQGVIEPIEFNDDGSLRTTGDPSIVLQINGFDAPQVLQFAFTSGSSLQSLNNQGNESTELSVLQNGFTPGTLKSANVKIDADGRVVGIVNGRDVTLAQLAIVSFQNPEGLVAIGDNLFSRSLNSGDPDQGVAGTGSRGQIRGGQLESSNVDIAFEFTRLIVAQRGFSANARTITVSDEVLEELTNIIR